MRMPLWAVSVVYVCLHLLLCVWISVWEEIVGIPMHVAEVHDNMTTQDHERSGFVFPEDCIMACHSVHGLPTYARGHM